MATLGVDPSPGWITMKLRFLPDSGFVARNGGPSRDRPEDWVVWHFTHKRNLPAICSSGALMPAANVTPVRSVANEDVKARRTYDVQPDSTYPASTVHDHVPFYIAAKSPMLFAVTSPGSQSYKAKSADLVFLGVVLGEIVESGATWCVSDGNAASGYTTFSRELDSLGSFVDFDLLCQKMWRNTPDDPYRQGRRAAELLVHGSVSLDLVRVVTTRDESGLAHARACFADVGGERQYHSQRGIFYN